MNKGSLISADELPAWTDRTQAAHYQQLSLPLLSVDHGDEPKGSVVFHGDPSLSVLLDELHPLLLFSHRHDHEAIRGQLIEQLFRNVRGSTRNEDPIEGGKGRSSFITVPEETADLEAVSLEQVAGFFVKLLVSFNADHSASHSIEHSGLIARSGPDLEDPMGPFHL